MQTVLMVCLFLAFDPTMSVAGGSTVVAAAGAQAVNRDRFRKPDKDVQDLKKEFLDLNQDLNQVEEALLFPAESQTGFFVALDVGEYFTLDSVKLKIDGKEVANYLYKKSEVAALQRGGVHRLHMANLETGDHELTAVFVGKGSNARDYRRETNVTFNKQIGAKYVTLEITDRIKVQQPELVVRNWE